MMHNPEGEAHVPPLRLDFDRRTDQGRIYWDGERTEYQ